MDLNQVEQELLKRWPETRLEPTLDRILALTDALGSPQLSYPTIHIGGTNGKTSTTRMIDSIMTELGYRVGRFTSPHLEKITERISIKGEPISEDLMVKTYVELAPYFDFIDSKQPHPISFFEAITAIAFAAFADFPVDVGVIEVGMGGEWDATNVVQSQVSVMTPIGLDHMQYLGDTIEKIAKTKSGIFKPESNVVLSAQEPEAAKVLLQKVAQVSAIPFREGMEFSLLERNRAVGGQLLKIAGIHREYEDLFLPLYGDHQAHNATVALAAAEAFTGVALDEELVRNAFAKASSPGRFEIIKRNPTVIVDAAHNPHGMSALMKTLNSEFDFQRVIGVIGVMADKDVAGLIDAAKKGLDLFIATQNSSTRSMPAAQLAAIAGEFIPDKSLVIAESDLKQAIQSAIQQATDIENTSDSNAAVLIAGSVVTAGEAKTILREIYGDRK